MAQHLRPQLPGVQDTAEAKRQIGATATLEFRAVTGDEGEQQEGARREEEGEGHDGAGKK